MQRDICFLYPPLFMLLAMLYFPLPSAIYMCVCVCVCVPCGVSVSKKCASLFVCLCVCLFLLLSLSLSLFFSLSFSHTHKTIEDHHLLFDIPMFSGVSASPVCLCVCLFVFPYPLSSLMDSPQAREVKQMTNTAT